MKDNLKTIYITHSLTGILDIIICLLLFISSIYKGAFYKADFLFPNVAISLVGLVYLIYKIIKEIMSKKDFKPKSKIRILVDGFMLISPFIYVLPIVFKTYASLPDSIFEMLRYVNMTIIYFLVRNTKNEKIYFNIFLLISVVQMILGIDQMTTRTFEEFLNSLSTGYLPDKERLSGTLQYANITGIVIGIGVIYCFNRITELFKNGAKTKYIKLIIAVFTILFGVSSIFLTESRVASITIILLLVMDSIFNLINIKREIGVFKLLLIIYSILTSGLIEKFVIENGIARIYIALTILSILFVILYKLLISFSIWLLKNTNNRENFIKNKTKTITIVITIMIVFVSLIISIPKNIIVENSGKEKTTFSKNIYEFKEGKNKVKIKVDSLSEDTRYTIKIRYISRDYRDYELATYNYYDNISGNFSSEVNVPEDARKLVLYIEIQKGKLELEEFVINSNKLKLSYLLLPDELINKLEDTLHGVYGDELRLTYAKDSIKLLKNSPLIGVGGEGFKHTYGSVQQIPYISSEAHSAILQSLVEVGVIGTTILIGIIILSCCVIIKLIIRINIISDEEKNHAILIISIYLALLSVVIFDLAFSYAFMIYVFAVITAILMKIYLDLLDKYNERKDKKSAIDWTYVKIVVLSLSVVALGCVTYFSLNAYRASLIKLPNKGENLTATEVAENIAYLELKNSQDKFDIDYMRELNEEYTEYKEMLTEAIINAGNDKKLKEQLQDEQEKLLVSIKNNTDKMLEYEYYDKYVLNTVADTYIYNYINFAKIYKEQFSNEEVAYMFYLSYALKLTDRIIELNPYSKKAHEIYINMCNEYIEELEADNKYLQSEAVSKIIEEYKQRIK